MRALHYAVASCQVSPLGLHSCLQELLCVLQGVFLLQGPHYAARRDALPELLHSDHLPEMCAAALCLSSQGCQAGAQLPVLAACWWLEKRLCSLKKRAYVCFSFCSVLIPKVCRVHRSQECLQKWLTCKIGPHLCRSMRLNCALCIQMKCKQSFVRKGSHTFRR